MKQKSRLKFRNRLRQILIGKFSLVLGFAVIVVSSILLVQSLANHKDEVGVHYKHILEKPFEKSNWMKSSIPIIVVSSIGIVLGSIQVLSSIILIYVNRKLRILALAIWLGAHMMIFICNIICFSLAISVKAHEDKHKDMESHIVFWKNFQFGSKLIPNVKGLAYSVLLAGNSIFIMISISLTAPILYEYDMPITLPTSSY